MEGKKLAQSGGFEAVEELIVGFYAGFRINTIYDVQGLPLYVCKKKSLCSLQGIEELVVIFGLGKALNKSQCFFVIVH